MRRGAGARTADPPPMQAASSSRVRPHLSRRIQPSSSSPSLSGSNVALCRTRVRREGVALRCECRPHLRVGTNAQLASTKRGLQVIVPDRGGLLRPRRRRCTDKRIALGVVPNDRQLRHVLVGDDNGLRCLSSESSHEAQEEIEMRLARDLAGIEIELDVLIAEEVAVQLDLVEKDAQPGRCRFSNPEY
jgi:hypothetical protein